MSRAGLLCLLPLIVLAGCQSAAKQEELGALRQELRALRQKTDDYGRLLAEQAKLLDRLARKLDAISARGPHADSPEPPPQQPKAPNFTALVKQVSPGRYLIPRAVLDEVLANSARYLATTARIVPHLTNGQPSGFKLFAIRPGSIYQALGLQNGDSIQQINGMELTTPDRALEVYTKVRQSDQLSIGLRRRGKPLTLTYVITEPQGSKKDAVEQGPKIQGLVQLCEEVATRLGLVIQEVTELTAGVSEQRIKVNLRQAPFDRLLAFVMQVEKVSKQNAVPWVKLVRGFADASFYQAFLQLRRLPAAGGPRTASTSRALGLLGHIAADHRVKLVQIEIKPGEARLWGVFPTEDVVTQMAQHLARTGCFRELSRRPHQRMFGKSTELRLELSCP